MAKKSGNRVLMIFQIFWEGIVWYCKYLDTFIKYMFFPVFGQIFGIFLIFAANYFFIENIPELVKKFPVLDNIPLVFLILILIVTPGFLIFGKAFFDYLISLTSLNSMAYVSRGDKMKNKPIDTKTHDDLLKKRLGKYFILLALMTLFFLIGLFPLFIIPFGVLCVFFCLVFQVFMLEESTSPIGTFKRSFYLVKTNFGITFLLLTLSFLLTYYIIPNLFVFGFGKAKLIPYLAYPIQKYIEILPIKELCASFIDYTINNSVVGSLIPQNGLNATDISFNMIKNFDTVQFAQKCVVSTISTAVIIFLMPMRCAWFTLLYKTFDSEKTEELRKSENNRKGK